MSFDTNWVPFTINRLRSIKQLYLLLNSMGAIEWKSQGQRRGKSTTSLPCLGLEWSLSGRSLCVWY